MENLLDFNDFQNNKLVQHFHRQSELIDFIRENQLNQIVLLFNYLINYNTRCVKMFFSGG
jgi:hypothetical protein